MTLSAFRGQWVLVDFWGTWCEPCVKDVPKTERLYQTLLDSRAKATILTVAVDDEVETIKAFMRARKLTFPVLIGDDETVKR
ncbi:MAG: TlpA family protein disulfide reductase, partial [Acidobacteria bacterium]